MFDAPKNVEVAERTKGDERNGGWRDRRWMLLWLAGIAIFYWIPVFGSVAKWGRSRELPRRLTFQHAVAALFPNRQGAWSHPIYRVRTEKTGEEWVELDRWLMSEAEVAGYRHRVDRLISIAAKAGKPGNSIFAGLAEHAAARVAKMRPELGAVTGFRVLTLVFPTNIPEMASPEGVWVVPALEGFDPKRVRLTAEVRVKDGKAAGVRRGSAPSPASKTRQDLGKEARRDEQDLQDGQD